MYAYLRVCDDITEEINSGALAADQKLLTEKEMCDKYDVSISTIRKSMYFLRDKGLIYSKRGSGYYVSQKKPEYSNLQRPSLSKLGTEPGAETEVISFTIKRCNINEAKALKIKVNSIVYEIIRKRQMNGKLNMYEINLIPVELIPDLLEEDAKLSLNKAYLENNIDRIKVKNKLVKFDEQTLALFKPANFNQADINFNLERRLELLDGKVVEYSRMIIFEEALNFEYIHLY